MKSTPIALKVRGVGHCPSFKNAKRIVSRGRHKGLITKPEIQEWMERVARAFELQLSSEFQTRGIEITTGPSALSLIASLLPLDDSRKWIPEFFVSTLLVKKGEEGADILIERIDEQEP